MKTERRYAQPLSKDSESGVLGGHNVAYGSHDTGRRSMSKMSGMVCPKYGVGTVPSLSDRRLSKMSRSIVSIASVASVASVEDCPECAGAVSRMCRRGVQNVPTRCPECADAVSRMRGRGVQNVPGRCPECAGPVSGMCGAGVQNARARCPECAGAVSRMFIASHYSNYSRIMEKIAGNRCPILFF